MYLWLVIVLGLGLVDYRDKFICGNRYWMESEIIKLKKSVMPMIGMGTHQLTGPDCIESVKKGIELGYRLIDTAECY